MCMFLHGFVGSMDPYQRAPRSPRGKKFNQTESSGNEDGCRSPTTDQVSRHFTSVFVGYELFYNVMKILLEKII